MSNFIQMWVDKLKTVKGYPYTLEKAVFDDNGQSLENKLSGIKSDITKSLIQHDNVDYSQSSGVGTQSITVDKDGIYIITCSVRCFGGSTPDMFGVSMWPVDKGLTTDDPTDYIYMRQYAFSTLTQIAYLTAGTHSISFECEGKTEVMDVRTKAVRV